MPLIQIDIDEEAFQIFSIPLCQPPPPPPREKDIMSSMCGI